MTRTVQARQRGKCIFTTTCSFMREGSGGEKTVDHQWEIPEGVVDELTTILKNEENAEVRDTGAGANQPSPFLAHRLSILNRMRYRFRWIIYISLCRECFEDMNGLTVLRIYRDFL